MKRQIGYIFVGALVLALVITMPVPALANKGYVSPSSVELRLAMRQLWTEHVVYTRDFITSTLGGLEDSGKVAERLLKNQDDIGNAIKPIYGDAAGTKLAALLRDHATRMPVQTFRHIPIAHSR